MVAVIGDDNSGRLASGDTANVDEAPASPGRLSVSPAQDGASGGLGVPEEDGAGYDPDETGGHGTAETNGGPVAEEEDDDEDGDEAAGHAVADLEQESEIAADYIEGLLDVADLDGDIDMDVEGDRPVVSVVGATLSELVGPQGEVLEALQELTRLAVHRQTGVRSRIMLDIGGYRARRREELTLLGTSAAEEVSRTGVARRLEPMTPFERKVVHDAVAAAGLRSESEGEEPDRRVVVFPVG